MACDYKFTNSAEKDLDDILDYISNKLQNPVAAANFISKLEETIFTVIDFPKCGNLVENEFLAIKSIRKLPIQNYMFYYELFEFENYILILRIIYGKRNPEQIIRGLYE